MDHPALQAHRIQPGSNVPPVQGGGLKTRGPDRRPRRLMRNMLLAALAAEGPITVEVQGAKGGVRKRVLWGRQAAAHQLLVAVQQIARQANRNPMAVLRLMELIAQEVDGRPMPAGSDAAQRSTTFVYEGQEEAQSVAEVVDRGKGGGGPALDEPFERMDG